MRESNENDLDLYFLEEEGEKAWVDRREEENF